MSIIGQTILTTERPAQRLSRNFREICAGSRAVYIALGILLLVAAGLKSHQLVTAPPLNENLLTTRWIQMVVIEFELLWGLWLVLGHVGRGTWLTTLACFLAFCGVSAYKIAARETDCGCFGRVPVSPWVSFAMDLMAICALIRFPANNVAIDDPFLVKNRINVVGCAFLLTGLPLGVFLYSNRPGYLGTESNGSSMAHIILLKPEEWLNHECPLLPYIDIGAELVRGRWTVVLVHHDCAKCREALPHYRLLAESARKNNEGETVAVVELPPFGPVSTSLPDCEYGRLSDNQQWFVETPYELVLDDGRVIEAKPSLRRQPLNQQS